MQDLPRPFLSVAIVCFGGGGCASADQPLEPQELRSGSQEVSFDTVEGANTLDGGITDRRRLVIDDRKGWVDFWSELYANIVPRPDPPSIDFDKYVVVAATMGQRRTGGSAIRIEGIWQVGDQSRVLVIETSPGALCVTIQALTAPATVVVVPRPLGEVEFVEETETGDCG